MNNKLFWTSLFVGTFVVIEPKVWAQEPVPSIPMDVMVHIDDIHVTGRAGDLPDNPDVYAIIVIQCTNGKRCWAVTDVVTTGICTHPHVSSTLLCKDCMIPANVWVQVWDQDGFLRDGDDIMNAPVGLEICTPLTMGGAGWLLIPPGPHATTSISWVCVPDSTGEEEAVKRGWRLLPSQGVIQGKLEKIR